MNSIKVICNSLIAALLSACGTHKEFVKFYDGNQRSIQEVAIVKPKVHLIVESFDGDSSKSFVTWRSFGSADGDLAILPGTHQFEMSLDLLTRVSVNSVTITYDFKAGRKYFIDYTQGIGKLAWKPFIVDVTDDPSRWCISGSGCNK